MSKKVFISYRHENETHRALVHQFATRLREALQDSPYELIFDEFFLEHDSGGPSIGWNRWSDNMANIADKVLVMGSPNWFLVFDNPEADTSSGGFGSAGEANVIGNRFSENKTISNWLRVVILESFPQVAVSRKISQLRQFRHPDDRDFNDLVRWIFKDDAATPTQTQPARLFSPPALGAEPPKEEKKKSGSPPILQPANKSRRLIAGVLVILALLIIAGTVKLTSGIKQPVPPKREEIDKKENIPPPDPPPNPDPDLDKKSPPETLPGALHTVSLGNNIVMNFRWCPPGSLLQGRLPEEYIHLKNLEINEEKPAGQREVSFQKGFWIGETEVTENQWSSLEINNPVIRNGNLTPKANVSLGSAEAYCKKLSARVADKGLEARLPTESEWEYACRSGTKTIFSFGNEIDGQQANYDTRTALPGKSSVTNLGRSQPVGSYPANAWGIRDMHGNLAEWCENPASMSAGITRGGHWNAFYTSCTSGASTGVLAKTTSGTIGFRVILTEK